jgi:TPP-dependent pyruvate/acetoin dehydrogenase alpha subunit
MEEGKVAEWLKTTGSPVSKGEVIATVETDKATFDVESPADGVLLSINVEAGATVPVGTTIGVIGERTPAPPPPASATAPERPRVRVKAGSVRTPMATPMPAVQPTELPPDSATRANDLPGELLVKFWRDMVRIRAFEQAAVYQSSLGKIYGALHSYEGQESCAVGICAALTPEDYVSSTHRGHGHSLAKGARMDRMMAELFGRVDGSCRGKGGSLHIADVGVGMLGANGIVGAGYAIGAGAALHAKIAKNGRVSVVFFGDGATTRGTFHEVMNMASLWRLPLILVCENNEYAQYMHWSETMVFDDIASLAAGYKMPGVRVDGNDIRMVYAVALQAVQRARSGAGPTLIELRTQRFHGHSSGDPQVYRSKSQIEELKRTRDPIAALEAELVHAGLLHGRDAQMAAVEAEVAEAIRFAEGSPYPPAAEFAQHVYA